MDNEVKYWGNTDITTKAVLFIRKNREQVYEFSKTRFEPVKAKRAIGKAKPPKGAGLFI